MGRNKNKNNRSSARPKSALQAGGGGRHVGQGGSKKDTGLPAFFKRRQADARQQLSFPSADGDPKDDVQMGSSAEATSTVQVDSSALKFERAARDLALSGKRDSSAKAFMREVKNVIENSDVILEVLDARDPIGSRSKQTEVLAMASGKKVVLIMNKVDLIPTSNLQAWLRYLRNDFPTLAFKASTQQQRNHLKQGRGTIDIPRPNGTQTGVGSDKLTFGSEAIGATALLQLLKNYARTSVKGSNLKQQLTVGVVGAPNVGKSSLINSLLRTRACAVASTPGWTKVVQGVMLEKGIRLLDCPGVVLGGAIEEAAATKTTAAAADAGQAAQHDAAWSVLRNTVKVELIEDPIAPIHAMLARVDAEQLIKLYSIDGGFNEGDALDFLLRVALLRGKLGKGGVPDLEGAARIVLHDWNIGRIAFHSIPPAVHPSLQNAKQATKTGGQDATALPSATTADDLTAGSSFVTGFSEAFDLDALLGEADAEALGTRPDRQDDQTGRGKDLIVPRTRVYAEDRHKELEAIEEDDEQIVSSTQGVQTTIPADTSRSSLGKRRRGMDEMGSSDEASSDEEDEVGSRGGLAERWHDDNEEDWPVRGRSPDLRDAMGDGTAAKREPVLNRQQRELQRAMGEYEVANMARRRGDVRRAAKKSQKKMRKSGAGLVEALNSGLALQGEEGHAAPQRAKQSQAGPAPSNRPERLGLFDVLLAQPSEPETAIGEVEEEEEL